MVGQRRKWTDFDQKEAMKQGWILASGDGRGIRIERLDSPDEDNRGLPRFADDSEAEAYVQGRADMGDRRAKRALKLAPDSRRA